MRVKSQYLFVIAVVAVLVLAFAIGTIVSRAGKSGKAEAKTAGADALPTVQAVLTPEATHEYAVAIRGRTEAARSVVVRSETAGVVAATPAVEGSFVRKGTVLCRLNVDARQATLDQARANLRSRQLQQKASAELAAKGYRFFMDSPTNQVFVILDNAQLAALEGRAKFGFWEKFDDSHTVVRIATSWATRMEEIEQLIALM